MRLDHVLCVLFVLALIIILTPGGGWLNPRTTIPGGEAGGSIIRDKAARLKITPVGANELSPISPNRQVSTPVETPSGPKNGYGFWKMVIKGGQ